MSSKADAGLRTLFHHHLPRFDFAPIESGQTSIGIPDTNFCCDGIEGFLECKACDHWRVEIRPGQVAWIERRIEHGGRVFIAVRRQHYELWLFHGCAIRDLVTKRLEEIPKLGRWNGGPAAWDWVMIGLILLGRK